MITRKHRVWAGALFVWVAAYGIGWADPGATPEAPLAEDIELLEPVKVSGARIVLGPRPIPWAGYDSGVVEAVGKAGTLWGDIGESLPRPAVFGARRLQDDTAARIGKRTPVQYATTRQPVYPRLAREAGWQGTVVVRVEVLEDGTAGSVGVGKSCGHEVLDDAAVAAVKSWRFAPLSDGGFTFRTTVQVPVVFDLRDP